MPGPGTDFWGFGSGGGGGGGGAEHYSVAPLSKGIGYGIPGRPFIWGSISTPTNGYVYMVPFMPELTEDFSGYRYHIASAVASALLDCALYTCTSWAPGATLTKVAATEFVGQDVSTTGAKTLTLGAPETLTAGQMYCLATLLHGGATAPQMYWLTDPIGYMGANPSGGTGAQWGGWIDLVGQTSLPSSITAAHNSRLVSTQGVLLA